MKSIMLSIAVLVLAAPLGGCVHMWNDDGHPGTESRSSSTADQQFWANNQWRKDIARDWTDRERRLSRMRLGEFID